MSIHNLSDIPRAAHEIDAPICLVGAGIAGLAAAVRLARNPNRRVIVIESGVRNFDQAIQDLNEVEDVFSSYKGAFGGRFRGLGGTSTAWGGRLLPLAAHDVEDREYAGAPAWPISFTDLERYRPDIEALFSVDNESFEEDVLQKIDRQHLLPRGHRDFVVRYPKWPQFKRCNMVNLLGEEVAQSPNLEVWLGATVKQFDLDPATGRLAAIRAASLSGRELTVRAREFLLTPGTIEATRLLLLLDAQSEGRVFGQCHALGRYFQDHVGIAAAQLRPRNRHLTNRALSYHFIGTTRRSLHFELSPAAQRAEQCGSGFAHVTMGLDGSAALTAVKKIFRSLQRGRIEINRDDLARLASDPGSMVQGAYWRYVRKQLHWPEGMDLQLNIWIEQLPHWDNRISLSEKRDRLGVPMARVEWRPREAEERTFQACIRRLRDYWHGTGLEGFCDLEWMPDLGHPDIPAISTASDLLHPSGSTRMGTDPKTSVVGPDLSCHAVPNLSVASASVFPSAGSANPTYTILQLAFRAADTLAKRVD